MTAPATRRAPPFISVIIPCYNYARHVAQAIESAIGQAYPRREVIVVNDGSTDDSPAVISRYAGAAHIIDQPNQGHIAACNRGFAASRGDLVIFLDADDWLEPGALEAIAAAWYPACAKVQFDLRIVDGAGTDLGRRFCNFSADYDAERVRRSFRRSGTYRWPVTSGNAYARWFLNRLFPLRIALAPDGTLNTVAPVYGDVVSIPRVLGAYRLHGANMWSSDGLDHARLPARIQLRQSEVALMREHAARAGVTVPAGDVLDHELPLINYRMMARKLGLHYPGSDTASTLRLLWSALRTARAERLGVPLTVAHLAWFLTLALAPRALARRLIRLRFNRGAAWRPVRRRLARLRAGFGHAR
ncbi:MAG TPA: glycosyltransferase family A protein [Polyangia bacterium]|nr:glycosyltransferase family A protein [Polyangia bacterium]